MDVMESLEIWWELNTPDDGGRHKFPGPVAQKAHQSPCLGVDGRAPLKREMKENLGMGSLICSSVKLKTKAKNDLHTVLLVAILQFFRFLLARCKTPS